MGLSPLSFFRLLVSTQPFFRHHYLNQELMSCHRRRRSMKRTQPVGCHDNPNQSPVSFHIRKVQSCYLKPYMKLRVTIFVMFKKMVAVLSVQAGVQ